MRNEHLSSVQKKVTELQLNTWLQLVWPHSNKTSSVTTQQNSKSAGQLSGLFVKRWGMNTSHLFRKRSPNCLQLQTWLQLVWPHSNETSSSVINQDLLGIQGSTFFLWKDEHPSSTAEFWNHKKECLKSTAKSWPLHGQHEQVWFWNQHSLLGMGSCSILAIKVHNLFHIKVTHIENCFCSVEQSLPLAKKAKSPAWPLAWLAILTKQNSLPNL